MRYHTSLWNITRLGEPRGPYALYHGDRGILAIPRWIAARALHEDEDFS